LNNDVIWHYMRRYRNFEKRQAFREAVAVANTHNPVLAVGSSAETDWEEINKMRLISARRNRKLFGVFAISLLVCAAACCLTLAANAQTNSTAAKIEVKLSEYKIDMPDTVPAGSTTFEVTNTGKEVHNFEIEGNGIEKRVGKLKPGESKTLLVELKAGKYEVYCPVPGHKSHGMSLDLTVR
jgi:uncharacterized cupredoxin-like copper-binding protein